MRYRLITLLGVVTVTAIMTAVLRVEKDWGTFLLWPSWTAGSIHVVERTFCRGAGAVLRMCWAIGGGCLVGALVGGALVAVAQPSFYDDTLSLRAVARDLLGAILFAGLIHGASGGALFGMMQGVFYAVPRRRRSLPAV